MNGEQCAKTNPGDSTLYNKIDNSKLSYPILSRFVSEVYIFYRFIKRNAIFQYLSPSK